MSNDSRAPRGAEPRRSRKRRPKFRDVTIALTPEAVDRYGAQEAIVLRQVCGWIEWHPERYEDEDGYRWFDASAEDLSELTGLSVDTVRREVRKLVDRGLVDRKLNVNGRGMQKASYRPLVDFATGQKLADPGPGDSATPTPGDSATPAPGDSATPTYSGDGDSGDKPPPSPSDGGGDGVAAPELFAEGRKGKRRRQVGEAKAEARSMVVAAADTFWEDWPSGKGRGQKATFVDAWCKRLAAGVDRNKRPVTISDYMARRDHYRDARGQYHRFWKARGVEAHAPMLNGSTFVNSKSHLWAEPWGEDDLRYWPPPRGYSWDDAPAEHGAVIGPSMFEALEAEIAADRAAKEAG